MTEQADKVWSKGYPARPGIYLCRVDKEAEVFLVNHYCDLNRRCRWQTLKGGDVFNRYVEWTGETVGLEAIDKERAHLPLKK